MHTLVTKLIMAQDFLDYYLLEHMCLRSYKTFNRYDHQIVRLLFKNAGTKTSEVLYFPSLIYVINL